jgi:dethiobiotin synthetase
MDWRQARGLFVTGTDTGCGKTEISLGLMQYFQNRGLRVLGMKPVASGSEPSAHGLRNQDALRLQAQGSLEQPYNRINPYAFELPVAPHLEATRAGRPIELAAIRAGYLGLAAAAERVIVEGVGGWRVPLGAGFDVAGLARALDLPVVLVVGLRLGCLNHALLSAEAILAAGCTLAGWVANRVDPEMLLPEENLATLAERLPVPCLGQVPWMPRPQPEAVAAALAAA